MNEEITNSCNDHQEQLLTFSHSNSSSTSSLHSSTQQHINNNNKHKRSVSPYALLFTLMSPKEIILLILGILCSIITAVNIIAYEVICGNTINHLYELYTNKSEYDSFYACIYTDIKRFMIIACMISVVSYVNFYSWFYIGQTLTMRYRVTYFELVLNQDQQWFDRTNIFEMSSRIENELSDISNALGYKYGYSIHIIFLFISSVLYCLTINVKVTLSVCAVVPLMMFILYTSMNKSDDLDEMKDELAKAGGFVEEALYNRKTIDAFNTQQQEIKSFKCYLRKAERSCLRQIILYALFYGLSEIIGHAMEGGSLVFYAYVVSDNKSKFLIGNLLEIVNILIFEECMSLNEGMPCIKAVNLGCASAKNFFALYSKSKSQSKTNSSNNSNNSVYDTLLQPNKNELQNKEIIFHDVNFTYSLSTRTNKAKPQFHILNASFPLKPNTVNTIIGESGSGKSTLLSLLQKIYPIHSGNITIGKYNINSINTCYLRNLIGYVPQEPLLMNTTIRDNITMGRTGITDVDIYNICEQTHLNELINNKADGLNYVVGVNGSKLSGGEKQRIALARALIGKPLLLILDEPTSALDNLNIKYINDTVRMLSKSITVVCVEHRVNYIEGKDWVVVVREGKVVDYGWYKDVKQRSCYIQNIQSNSKTNANGEHVQRGHKRRKTVKSERSYKHVKVISDTNTNVNEVEMGLEQREMSLSEVKVNSSYISISNSNTTTSNNVSLCNSIINITKINKKGILLLILCSIISGAMWPFVGNFFSLFSTSITNTATTANYLKLGLTYCLYYCILAIIIGCVIFSKTISYESYGNFLSNYIRGSLFQHLMSLPLNFFHRKENNPGSLFAKLSFEASKVNFIVFTAVGVIIESFVSFAVCILIGFHYHIKITLITLFTCQFTLLEFYLRFYVQSARLEKEMQIVQDSSELIVECLYNIKTIRAYNFKDKAIEMINTIIKGKDNVNEKLLKTTSTKIGMYWALSSILLDIATCVNFYFGAKYIYDNSLSFDDYFHVYLAFQLGVYYLSQSQFYVDDFSQAYDALKSLNQFVATSCDGVNPLNQQQELIKVNALKGHIEFKHLCFGYVKGTYILNSINVDIRPGQRVGIVGHSGSGKSTIIQLIERFYHVKQGMLSVDGVDINLYNVVHLRERISYLEQDAPLFRLNVKDNIKYGNERISDNEVQMVCKKLKIDYLLNINDIIINKDNDDDSSNSNNSSSNSSSNSSKADSNVNVNNKYTPISGGERQRIAIARVLLRKADVYLFDEPSTSLDLLTEKDVMDTIKEYTKGKTTIIISHRLATLTDCDCLYFIDSNDIRNMFSFFIPRFSSSS